MKKIYIIAIIFSLSFNMVTSQESFFSANYTAAIPMGSSKSYIDNTSWRGVSFEHRHFIDALLTVGVNFGWQVLNKKLPDQTEYFESGVLYANQYRYINAYPLLATTHYHLWPEKYFRPYFGTGIGVYNINQVTEMGLYSSSISTWNFGIAPELGILYDLSPEFNLLAAVSYNYAFKSGKSDGYSALNFKFGFVWVRL